eukprot:8555692-Pyramimonas_sp.AAC.1
MWTPPLGHSVELTMGTRSAVLGRGQSRCGCVAQVANAIAPRFCHASGRREWRQRNVALFLRHS